MKANGAMYGGHRQAAEESNDFTDEPSSIFISDDWDVINDDFLDDFDDLGDVDFPTLDDDF